jgi:hypothetical protein
VRGPERDGRQPCAVEDLGGQRAGSRQQAGDGGVLDQRRGREASSQRFDREREVEQSGAGATLGLGHGHSGCADRDQLLPELGREPEGLVIAHALERRRPLDQCAEDVDDRLLLGRRVEIH